MKVQIKRVDKEIELPKYAKKGDAALDLSSAEEHIILPSEKKNIRTGIKMAIPEGHVGLVWDRSGLAAKHSIHTIAGVIDSGYRGEIGVVLVNLGKEEFRVQKGMRIAQLLIQPVADAELEEVSELEETERGASGFGSTDSL